MAPHFVGQALGTRGGWLFEGKCCCVWRHQDVWTGPYSSVVPTDSTDMPLCWLDMYHQLRYMISQFWHALFSCSSSSAHSPLMSVCVCVCVCWYLEDVCVVLSREIRMSGTSHPNKDRIREVFKACGVLASLASACEAGVLEGGMRGCADTLACGAISLVTGSSHSAPISRTLFHICLQGTVPLHQRCKAWLCTCVWVFHATRELPKVAAFLLLLVAVGTLTLAMWLHHLTRAHPVAEKSM